MKGENFSLYKNIKKLCKEIYQSIKFNNSYNLNICSESFREINNVLKDKIQQKGGYSQNVEELKSSIINKINDMKRLNNLTGGVISQTNIDLRETIISKIKGLEMKDIRQDLKTIEKTLNQVLIFIETYKTLQKELKDKQKIIDGKYNPDSKDLSVALRGLMSGISPTELTTLQENLKQFTENIQTIVNPPPTGTDDLAKSIKDSCKTYLPNTNLSITPSPSSQLLTTALLTPPPRQIEMTRGSAEIPRAPEPGTPAPAPELGTPAQVPVPVVVPVSEA